MFSEWICDVGRIVRRLRGYIKFNLNGTDGLSRFSWLVGVTLLLSGRRQQPQPHALKYFHNLLTLPLGEVWTGRRTVRINRINSTQLLTDRPEISLERERERGRTFNCIWSWRLSSQMSPFRSRSTESKLKLHNFMAVVSYLLRTQVILKQFKRKYLTV